MGNSFMTSAVFAAIMALRSEFKEERQASSRPRRTEDRTIIVPSRPTKLQYRRIKRDIRGSLIGNTILVLVLVVLPAGLFCWAFLPLIVDGNYIAFYFLLFVALIFFSILRPLLKTIEKRNNELEKLNKNYQAVKKEEKINEDGFLQYINMMLISGEEDEKESRRKCRLIQRSEKTGGGFR